jgi:hypothetical protein
LQRKYQVDRILVSSSRELMSYLSRLHPKLELNGEMAAKSRILLFATCPHQTSTLNFLIELDFWRAASQSGRQKNKKKARNHGHQIRNVHDPRSTAQRRGVLPFESRLLRRRDIFLASQRREQPQQKRGVVGRGSAETDWNFDLVPA